MKAIRITLLATTLFAAACSAEAVSTESAETASTPTAVTQATAAATPEAMVTESPTDVMATATGVPTVQPQVAEAAEPQCPVGDFLLEEVNAYVQQDYEDPELAVTCDETSFTVTSNNIPNFEFVQITPNDLAAQDLSLTLPLEPIERETPGTLPLGTIGVAVNGLAIFGAFEAPQHGYQDPLLDGLLDYCNGHTAPRGDYHFHARFDCVFEDPEEPGLVYGYAADGYPILSQSVCADEACAEIERMTSSYVRIDPKGLGAFDAWEYVEGAGDLDACNGAYDADGNYAYYATDDFPYLTFCFHGETDLAAGDFVGQPPAGR